MIEWRQKRLEVGTLLLAKIEKASHIHNKTRRQKLQHLYVGAYYKLHAKLSKYI